MNDFLMQQPDSFIPKFNPKVELSWRERTANHPSSKPDLVIGGTRGIAASVTAMARNLIKNNCGEEELECWEILQEGGDGWKVEEVPGDCGAEFPDNGAHKYFASSFDWCSKSQLIDLLAEGFTEEALDAQPNIVVSDWYAGRTDAGCLYELCVELLSGSQEVLAEYQSEMITIPQCPDNTWNQISHTFSGYGPGVRFIRFKHGGQDSCYWKGWFGARVTNSSVTVEA
ncbi:F-box only protein 2-like [Gastrophryne carolinensis]